MDTTTDVLDLAAKSLRIPAARLRRWRTSGDISIEAIPAGWRMELHREPAISGVSAAATRR